MHRYAHAFTLIELLVVITIIVVLLALLTPALDRAIYQAELAVCGTRVHAIAQGSLAYAFEYRRKYPAEREAADEPHRVSFSVQPFDENDRPLLQLAFSLELLNDPLTGEVDFDSPAESIFYSSYYLWMGFGYDVDGRSERAMTKVGDRFTWTDDTIEGGPIKNRFNLLACDQEVTDLIAGATQSGHPDHDGIMSNEVVQDGQVDLGGITPPDFAGITGVQWSVARWLSVSTHKRGPIDMNFAHDDGSVTRINNAEWDAPLETGSRLARVPHHKGADNWENEQWCAILRE